LLKKNKVSGKNVNFLARTLGKFYKSALDRFEKCLFCCMIIFDFLWISKRYGNVRHTLPDALCRKASERGTEHGYGKMVIGAAAAFGTASFGSILLLCDEEPDEVLPA